MLKLSRLQRRQAGAWAFLIVIMLVYATGMSVVTILRYTTFKATAFDLGNLDQALWNTIHGRWFEFTNQSIDYYGPPTRLAVHFEPIIVPLSLLYAFGADPRILLVFQTLALTAGALPVFLLTRYYIPRWPLVAPLMALAYFLAPALLGLNLFDFHPLSLATPALLYAVLALTYKRHGWFLLACVIAASSKEDVPLAVALLGILVMWKYKQPRLGLAVFIGGCLWSFLAFEVIIPHFFPGQQSNNFWYRYEQLGNTPGQAIVNLLLHPWLIFATFITLDRFYYVLGLFRSAGFLSLLAPEWLLPALPIMAVNFLSTDPATYSGVYHYNAAIIPFVMIAAIHGTRRLLLLWQSWRGEPVEEDIPLARARSGRARLAFPVGAAKLAQARQSTLSLRFATISAAGASIAQGQLTRLVVAPTLGLRQRIIRLADALNRPLRTQWQRFSQRMIPLAREVALSRLQKALFIWIIAMCLLNLVVTATALSALLPDHLPGSREQHIEQLLAMIPPTASVSASSNLNPHVSERQGLAVFPYITYDLPNGSSAIVQYVIVDLDGVFPQDRGYVAQELDHLQRTGQYVVLARAEGVVLLVRSS
ncbi:MAG: DUF2079 domain-containing protein, partial [Ktedonobacteraceae bacterium]